jgi:hypothetical protein
MSNTRKLRSTRPRSSRPSTISSRTAFAEVEPPRCECRHSYEPDGRCSDRAEFRATTVCGVADCDCAAGMGLACAHCVTLWQQSAERDGVEMRVSPL